ncbi:MAG: ATP-binding protein [Acidobacteriota bacterium]|nr:ATP-binding protein [Acidobacteriota bacterium]
MNILHEPNMHECRLQPRFLDAELVIALEQSDRQLNLANAKLLGINEDLKQFAFAASHDLQEPLRMLSIYSQLVKRNYQGRLDQTADEHLQTIADGAKRMRALLIDLLDYSTLMGEEGFLTPVYVEPNEVLDKVTGNLARRVELSQATITCQSLPCVYTSEVHLMQLFQNLISNAIKFRGSQPLQIDISAKVDGCVCTFAVKDNGIGIDRAYHKHIFGLFKRLHGKDVPGTGIGLAICQKIVERYGGRIWVEAQLDCGSRFCFELPAEPCKILPSRVVL